VINVASVYLFGFKQLKTKIGSNLWKSSKGPVGYGEDQPQIHQRPKESDAGGSHREASKGELLDAG
jgi:hypothetical protein